MSLFECVYYPHVEFLDEDWCKAMSLFWDKMYRIVPADFEPQDSETVKVLEKEGFLGRIDPEKYISTASEKFSDIITQPPLGYLPAALAECLSEAPSDGGDDEPHLKVRLLDGKTDEELRTLLTESHLAALDGSGMIVNHELAANYMCCLASVVSRANGLHPITDDEHAWISRTYFDEDCLIEENARWSVPGGSAMHAPAPGVLAGLCFEEILPSSAEPINLDKVLKLRQQRAPQRRRFMEATISFIGDLEQSPDSLDLEGARRRFREELVPALEEYRHSMVAGIGRKLFGTKVVSLPLVGAAFAKLFTEIPDLLGQVAGVSLGAVVGLGDAWLEARKQREANPVSYLSKLGGVRRSYLQTDVPFDHLNYHFDEFLND